MYITLYKFYKYNGLIVCYFLLVVFGFFFVYYSFGLVKKMFVQRPLGKWSEGKPAIQTTVCDNAWRNYFQNRCTHTTAHSRIIYFKSILNIYTKWFWIVTIPASSTQPLFLSILFLMTSKCVHAAIWCWRIRKTLTFLITCKNLKRKMYELVNWIAHLLNYLFKRKKKSKTKNQNRFEIFSFK